MLFGNEYRCFTGRGCGEACKAMAVATSTLWPVAHLNAQPAVPPFWVPWIGFDTAVYPEGYVSWASRSADFNGDGAPDLAISSWPANPVLSILLGDGAGRFAPPVMYPLPLGGLDLEVADFDGDKDIDIAVSNTGQFWEGTSFSLFTNTGNGAFIDAGQFAAGPGPTGMTTADFNGDGAPDLAVAHDAYIVSGNSIAIILNNGNGGFLSPQIRTLQAGTYKIDASDIDGDGDPDLAVAHETNRATVLRNVHPAPGGFDAGTVYPSIVSGTLPFYPTVTLADVDADNDQDMLYSHTDAGGINNGAIALFRNNGSGSFAAPETVPLIAGGQGAVDIEVADVTGDGLVDLIAPTERAQYWTLVEANGVGGFLPAHEFHAGEDPIAAEVADLDNDGDNDVVIIGRDSLEACVYVNPGAGQFIQPPLINMVDPALAPVSSSNLATGDIDGDGDLDLAVGFSANFLDQFGISLRRNNGQGVFAPPETYSASVLPQALRLRDLNGDGHLDLLWVDYDFTSHFRTRLNLGNGAFGPQQTWHGAPCQAQTIETGDLDNDGDLDVLVGGCNFEVKISLNNGNATFAPFLTHEVNGNTHAIALGDFNEDGFLDLLTPSGIQGYVERSTGNGNGTFDPPVTYPTGRDVKAIAVGHLDHDGDLDFAGAYNLDGVGLTVRRGRGNGDFFPHVDFHGSFSATWDQVRSIALGDADSDGHTDAMIANFGSQDISFWKGNGNGTFQRQIRYGVGQQATDLEFGDFTGDGRPDLAVLTEPRSPTNGWYYPAVVLLHGVGPNVIGDVNGDGSVNVDDLIGVILGWGACSDCANCPADVNRDCAVDVDDLILVILNWG